MIFRTVIAVFFFAFICLVQGGNGYDRVVPEPSNLHPDLVPAATGHHGHGRVQIKVYRGPSEGHEHFAPHGYWVKQPADDHHHHHH